MMRSNPKKVIFWLGSSIVDLKGRLENIPLYAWYLLILTPNEAAHISEAYFPDIFSDQKTFCVEAML